MDRKYRRLATVAKRRGRCEPQAVVTVEPAPEVLEVDEPVVAKAKPKKKKKASKKKSES